MGRASINKEQKWRGLFTGVCEESWMEKREIKVRKKLKISSYNSKCRKLHNLDSIWAKRWKAK